MSPNIFTWWPIWINRAWIFACSVISTNHMNWIQIVGKNILADIRFVWSLFVLRWPTFAALCCNCHSYHNFCRGLLVFLHYNVCCFRFSIVCLISMILGITIRVLHQPVFDEYKVALLHLLSCIDVFCLHHTQLFCMCQQCHQPLDVPLWCTDLGSSGRMDGTCTSNSHAMIDCIRAKLVLTT